MNSSRKFRARLYYPSQAPKDRAVEHKQNIRLTNLAVEESLKKNPTKNHQKPQKVPQNTIPSSEMEQERNKAWGLLHD